MTRRWLISKLFAAMAVVTGAAAQTAVMSGGTARVCEGDKTKCPLGHDTCRVINAALIVGNGDAYAPNWGQLNEFRMLLCDTCHVLFAERR